MTYTKAYDNDHRLTHRRRVLRSEATKAERTLWKELANKKTGYKFRKQYSILTFIIDFYCVPLRLAIELDGPIHEEHKSYDAYREHKLQEKGVFVLRFTNDKVMFERDVVMEKILRVCKEREAVLFGMQPHPALP